ncbi:hypothetical protein [Geomonas subterranea]|uniref:hypothetical protein n=1 Tax=Geomonas subterranea TaxID=2847989 RepID=UPI001CD48CDA|nr:hypothetical protein [Geomonas fuzhouensis]
MERIFYKEDKFTTRGEKFETPSGMGGSFTIEYIRRTSNGRFEFLRRRMPDWPEQVYTFSASELKERVYRLIPSRFDRLMLTDIANRKYEEMMNDPHVDRIVPA